MKGSYPMEAAGLHPADLEAYIDQHGLQARLIALPVPTPTVEAAAGAVGARPQQIVKSLLFWIESVPVIVVACGPSRVERRTLARFFNVARKKVKLMGAAAVFEISGYRVGAVPPFGHRTKLTTLVDAGVLQNQEVYAGGGAEDQLMCVAPEEIIRITGATVLDLQETSSAG
jgi:prolyl-tRNA editing enzyme YbaK/EbsC (Cys-tRNA(Pro) deacylase)